jgi:hypothetical protein
MTLSSDEVRRLTGITYRQLDNWCHNGVLGDAYKDPGSGTRRRFPLTTPFVVAVLGRVSEALQELTGERSGSTRLYADIVRALNGERVDNIAMTRTELTLMPTLHVELQISMYDLRRDLSKEKLSARK